MKAKVQQIEETLYNIQIEEESTKLDFENLSRLDGFVTSNLANCRLYTLLKTAHSRLSLTMLCVRFSGRKKTAFCNKVQFAAEL